MMIENEIWKDIPGYEGEYQASTLGRIKSLKRTAPIRNHYTQQLHSRIVPECILKPGRFNAYGHVSVILRHRANGQAVHRLVLLTFVGEPPAKADVLHLNGVPTDNRLSNLRYGTRTENILDVYTQGKIWRKLSPDDVQAIRFGIWCGISGARLAEMFGVCDSNIGAIKSGKTFAWLK